jgi:DHA1 family inner membrane transport protein
MTQHDTRWIIAALALCTASTGPQFVALSLLMPEITNALDSTITQLGQLNTAWSIIAIAGALIMGVLTVRYPIKRLLLAGIITLLAGIIIAAFSVEYTHMLLSFILYGVGMSLVLPTTSLLLVLFPLEQRTIVMGRIYSGRSFTSILATPVIGFLAARYGWRVGFIGFGAPLIILAIILVTTKIPELPPKEEGASIVSGFKKIASNKSALACLIGVSLCMTFFNSLMVFNGAYTRNNLNLPLGTASIAMSLTFLAVAFGQLLSGRLTQRIGVKGATWLSTFLSGASLLMYFSVSLPVPIAILASIIGTGMTGTTMTTMSALALEQEPDSRGTMMSLNSAAMSVSSMLSTLIGGIAIINWGFIGYGIVMFTITSVAAFTFYMWTHEIQEAPP